MTLPLHGKKWAEIMWKCLLLYLVGIIWEIIEETFVYTLVFEISMILKNCAYISYNRSSVLEKSWKILAECPPKQWKLTMHLLKEWKKNICITERHGGSTVVFLINLFWSGFKSMLLYRHLLATALGRWLRNEILSVTILTTNMFMLLVLQVIDSWLAIPSYNKLKLDLLKRYFIHLMSYHAF